MSTRILATGRWRKVIQQQRASGLSVAAFCRRSGVPQASFYAWRRKLENEVNFAEVKLPAGVILKSGGVSATDTGEIELRLPFRRCVVVRPGFDRQTLVELLQVLEASSFDLATREAGV